MRLPAGRFPAAQVGGSAAPGRASASGGEAASPCSPAPMRAPAQPAGKRRTPTGPPRSPPPG